MLIRVESPSIHDVLASLARWKFNLEISLGAIVLLFLGGGALSPAFAEAVALQQQLFDIWPAGEGWEQNTVTALLQTRNGYLWLGTYHGLVRFDGVRFTVFDSSNTSALKDGLITSLYEDPGGALWIGHETGQLSRLVNGQFESIALGSGWPGGVIEAISSDEHGDVWLLNDSGTFFRARDGYGLCVPGGASPSRKAVLARSRSGRLWLVSNGQAATLEQDKLVPFQFPDAQPTVYFERVLPSSDGGMWVVGNGRIRKLRQGRWVAAMPSGSAVAASITCLLETQSGALLAGTLRDGLYLLFAGAEPIHFSRTDGLSHDWVRALCQDLEGNLWIGTGAGFDSLRPKKVQMLNAPDGWRGCAVLSFAVEDDGSAWIGTEGAGLYHYGQGQWTTWTESCGLSNLFVWSVLETKQRQLLVGTFGGGLLVKEGERLVSEGDLARISAPVVALYEGRQGEIWIGTTTGLYRYQNGKITWSASKDKLVLPDVRAIAQSADGTLWFGMSGGGLGSFKDGVLKQIRKKDGLSGDFVVSLCPEEDGTLWVGTSDNGITRLKNGRFDIISTSQGLPTPIVTHLVDDGEGNLWIGSHAGILRASKAELNRCADGASSLVNFLGYGKSQGLASPICSGGFQPGAAKAADGRLWFPTAKGLAVVDPAGVTTNTVPPPVHIEAIQVDGRPLEEWVAGKSASGNGRAFGGSRQSPLFRGQQAVGLLGPRPGALREQGSLRIGPGSKSFEFKFTGLSFVAPDKVRFRYRLDGLESEWTLPNTKRSAEYSFLRPGKYVFRVTACNNDGIWNPVGASVAFEVLPYFWQTWWFEGSALAAGAGVVGALVVLATRRRLRRQFEQLERQRALERERARIARDIHDDLGASLTRITLLSQSVRSEIESGQQAADLDQIYSTARELTRAMDEIVWAVNPKHDTLDSLVTYLGRFAQNFLSTAGLRCRLEVPLLLPPWALTSEVRHNVFLAFKEALNNAVKHANATEVRVSLQLEPEGFVLLLSDNGRGFNGVATHSVPLPGAGRVAAGNGLLNMQKRLEEIGGRCEWDSALGEGTRVRLVVWRHQNSRHPFSTV